MKGDRLFILHFSRILEIKSNGLMLTCNIDQLLRHVSIPFWVGFTYPVFYETQECARGRAEANREKSAALSAPYYASSCCSCHPGSWSVPALPDHSQPRIGLPEQQLKG